MFILQHALAWTDNANNYIDKSNERIPRAINEGNKYFFSVDELSYLGLCGKLVEIFLIEIFVDCFLNFCGISLNR